MALSLIGKGIRALQKGRVQRALKPKVSKDYKPTGLRKHAKKKAVEKETARVQAEAQAGAKRAKRGRKTTQVEGRVLPEMSRVRAQLKGMSANDIAADYDGREIIAMRRKLKDPKLIARLNKALEKRKKIGRKFISERQGKKIENLDLENSSSLDEVPVPRKGSRGAALKAKYGTVGEDYKRGGTVKRKSGGKMNTDGNAYVAALYKGGKVGG